VDALPLEHPAANLSTPLTQFDRVIRAESYGSLRERLQKKAADAADAER
jgi:hypothetical protein